MENIRWYDKNPDLKRVFEFLQGLDNSVLPKVAQELMQTLVNDFGLDLDEEINNISKNYSYQCKRWYDKNIDLFTSFEIIKNLPIEKQSQVVEKIVEIIIYISMEREAG